ncbi:hypothetical protein XENOCAPTIV_027969 [Xenoophorus captivus]|uniref:Ig-like domain-containing protein n=1 Tax=Xenoophorus captivus TaxID=1517983 RepID=A0ABV0S3W9_9TELE
MGSAVQQVGEENPCVQLFLSPSLTLATSIQFTKEPKSQDALHGRSAMLRCEVSNPANITYRWYKDNELLKNTERRFQEGSNLKFTAVDRQLDAGNFSCQAQNSASGELKISTKASFNIKCECSLLRCYHPHLNK